VAQRWLTAKGYDFRLVRTYGATEVFPPDDADMIVDNTSTGQTLKDNGLRIVATVMESSTRFVASRSAMEDPEKRGRIEELATLFRAVLDGRDKVMLEMNVVKARFPDLVAGSRRCGVPRWRPCTGTTGTR